MIDDVGRAGGVVVLRGLPQNSAKALTAALANVARPGEQLTGVGIDPRLFRAFGVETVPTYVVTGSDFDLCDGFDCVTAVPPHDRMTGNVSAAYALETFARGDGPGALIAAQHLARLERPKP
jgi:conjugal transfer pilus assembly protein TrbC